MNKEKRIAIILVISSIILTVIGATFAYWRWEITNAQKTVVDFTVGSGFSCSADGGGSITSREKFLAPAACTNPTYAFQRTVKVNATTGTKPVYLNMWLKVNLIGSELANSDYFNYALTTSDQGCDQGTIVASGTFKGATQNSTFNLLEDKEYLTTTSNDTYYLYIWLDADETNNNTMNQDFDIELGGECSNHLTTIGDTLKQNAVMDNINSTYVNNTTPGIDFSNISSDTNGKGIYIRSGTENDSYPIYYYRGAVTDNNVLFGGFCWKIVRTTSTGGTKLIYNGSPTGTNNDKCNNTDAASQLASTSMFNNNDISPADVGYMYGTRYKYSEIDGDDIETKLSVMFTNTTDSAIKAVMDTWYADNMTSYTIKLEDTPFCNDRTIYQYGRWSPTGSQTSYLYLAPHQRTYSTYSPSLTCNMNDAFTVSASNGNGKLTYPVGLLTSDEIMLSGGTSSDNSTYYLYTNQNWWSGSPNSFRYGGANEFLVTSSGKLDSIGVKGAYGVRPAVSLKASTKFSGGDGTATNPYVVKTAQVPEEPK